MKNTITKIAVLVGAMLAFTATAQIQYSNAFWISTNATGAMYPNPTNGGTLDYPLDGSTAANFDANMNALPPDSVIHLLPGTYQTDEGTGGFVKSGQKYIGSGIDVTIVQDLDGLYVFYPQSADVTNTEISDLTADANGHNGIQLHGTRMAVRRVKVIDTFAPSGDECGGIGLNNYDLPYSEGNIIEECEITNHLGGAITAIGFAGGSGGTSISGIIRNNRIFLVPPFLANNTAEQGINNSWAYDTLIEGNYVNGADDGVYSDTGGYTNVIIAHNTFKNCYSGVCMDVNNSPEKNITIAFNNFDLVNAPAGGTPGAAVFNFWGGILTNVFIFGNTITSTNSSTSFLIAANNLTGLDIANNSIDSQIAANQVSWGTPLRITNVVNMNIDNNYDLFGNYLYDLNMPTLGGVAVSPFGLALVNSAEASSALTNLGLPSNPANVVTNNESGVTLSGTFSGNGGGLTNVPSPGSALCFGTIVTTFTGAYLTNSSGCTTTNSHHIVTVSFAKPALNTYYIIMGSVPNLGGGIGGANLTLYTNSFTFNAPNNIETNNFLIFSQ